MTVDRTPKPCRHKQARHQHGDRVTYVLDRCRCLPCAYAASQYELARRKRNAYGRSNYVDAEPARQHVAKLTAAGVGLKRIVALSGIPQGSLWKLVYGKKKPDGTQTPSRRITRATADRLLALDPGDPRLLADGQPTSSVGTMRRLQALACLGWSINRLADVSGLDRQRLDAALHGENVVAGTVRAVADLYDRLWDTPAPARDHHERISVSRAINRAQASSWAPPLAWDDDTIDDPHAAPFADDQGDDVDELAVEHVLDGQPMRLAGRELEVAALRLSDRGMTYEQIADRVRSDPQTIRRLLNTTRQRISRAQREETAA